MLIPFGMTSCNGNFMFGIFSSKCNVFGLFPIFSVDFFVHISSFPFLIQDLSCLIAPFYPCFEFWNALSSFDFPLSTSGTPPLRCFPPLGKCSIRLFLWSVVIFIHLHSPIPIGILYWSNNNKFWGVILWKYTTGWISCVTF